MDPAKPREGANAHHIGPGCVNYGPFRQWNGKQLQEGTQQFYGSWNKVQVPCCREKKQRHRTVYSVFPLGKKMEKIHVYVLVYTETDSLCNNCGNIDCGEQGDFTL